MSDLATAGPAEVAELIGASEWWVREQARKRRVPHLRFGRDTMRFRRDDVIAIMMLAAVEPRVAMEPEREIPPVVDADSLIERATNAYRLSRSAGRPERAARAAARKILPGFVPSRSFELPGRVTGGAAGQKYSES